MQAEGKSCYSSVRCSNIVRQRQHQRRPVRCTRTPRGPQRHAATERARSPLRSSMQQHNAEFVGWRVGVRTP